MSFGGGVREQTGCCCDSLGEEILSLGCLLCPILCPWLPLSPDMKQDCQERGHGPDRRLDPRERIMEEETEIRKQETDHCKYKYIMLSNGVKVLLVEDSKASTSACALEIEVGNFLDPPHLLGLAHLLEHTIFHASELFPQEGFGHFLGLKGGSNNAFTASTCTNFHFDIPKEHFLDALDRFVSYLVCPVFHEKTVENEVEIIQCEHEKNKFSDVWRLNQVERATANPRHPFSHFSTGTRKTLNVDPKSNKNLKYEAFNFFKRQYSANLMSFCLIHNVDLQKLEEIAVEKLSVIPNKNIPQTIWRSPVFRKDQLGLKLFIVPVREGYHLNLSFPLPDYDAHYRASPGGQLSSLLGHRGQGSLLSYLRTKGLAHHVVARHKQFHSGRFSLMLVSIQMTDHGERHVDSIIKNVFQYINMLRKCLPSEEYFQELKLLTEQRFQMKEREKAVSAAEQYAHALSVYAPEDILTGDWCVTEHKPELVMEMLERLRPDNLRVTILTKNAKYLETKVEPHYGTEYHVDRITEETLSVWRTAGHCPAFSLPPPNPLICSDPRHTLSAPGARNRRQPELFCLLDRIRTRSWWMPDTRFLVPKCHIYLKFSSASAYLSPRACNLNNLAVYALRDQLVEFNYTATTAGLYYSLKPTKYGFHLNAEGFSEKMPLLIGTIAEILYKGAVSQETFKTVIEVHRKGLQSCSSEPLKNQSKYLLNTFLSANTWTREQRLGALDDITREDVIHFSKNFLDTHSLECLFFGSLSKEQAQLITDNLVKLRAEYLSRRGEELDVKPIKNPNLEDWFQNDPVEKIVKLEPSIKVKKREIELTEASKSVNPRAVSPVIRVEDEDIEEVEETEILVPLGTNSVMIHNEQHTMSMMVMFLQLDNTNLEKLCLLEVFTHLVRERIVNKLREEVILGYVIGCDIRKLNNSTGLRIYVESQFPPGAVNDAIEECLSELEAYLKTLNHADFKIHINALKAAKMEAHMKMGDLAAMLWREVVDQSYDFRRHHRECEHLNFLTLSKVRQFYKQYIHQSGKNRRKLILSIAPDPTLNTIQEADNQVYSWLERPALRAKCESIARTDRDTLREWLVTVFRSEDDGYQPPGEEVTDVVVRRSPHQVHFMCPEMDRT